MNQTNENLFKINIDAKKSQIDSPTDFTVCNRLQKYNLLKVICVECVSTPKSLKRFVEAERAMHLKNIRLYVLKVKQQIILVSLKIVPLPNSLLFAAYMKLHFQFFQRHLNDAQTHHSLHNAPTWPLTINSTQLTIFPARSFILHFICFQWSSNKRRPCVFSISNFSISPFKNKETQVVQKTLSKHRDNKSMRWKMFGFLLFIIK